MKFLKNSWRRSINTGKHSFGEDRFLFFLATEEDPVSQEDELWNQPLPVHLNSVSSGREAASFGDYFIAVRNFLEADGMSGLAAALSIHLRRPIEPNSIASVRIFLEKHGAFYHPSRIMVKGDDFEAALAANAALSEAGRSTIASEFALLKRLNEKSPGPGIPRVYRQGDGIGPNGMCVPVFLAEWFEDFHEFHLSADPEDGRRKIVIWTPRGPYYPDAAQTSSLYFKAGRILAGAYDPLTLEQILSWRHAAGDFIVRTGAGVVELRLITVRRYDALISPPEKGAFDVETYLDATLLFLIHHSVWMRLDRLDGVGEVVWADDSAVSPVIKGFFYGWAERNGEAVETDPLLNAFRKYLHILPMEFFSETARNLLKTYSSRLPELPVIEKHLESHLQALLQAVHDIPTS